MQPPHNDEAERDVLGSVLLAESAWDEIGHTLESDDFFRPVHRTIWKAMEEAVETYGRADNTTLLEVLRRGNGKYTEVKPDYLLTVANSVPSPRNATTYARIVRELRLRRRLMEASQKVAGAAFSGEDFRPEVEDLVREVYRADAPGLQTARTGAEILSVPPDPIDALTDPPLIVKQGITVIASETKVGKTNLWFHAAWALTEGKTLFNIRVPEPVPVLLIELELSESTVHKRLTALKEILGWSDEGLGRFNVWCNRALQLDKRGGQQRLAQIIQSTVPRPQFVIIDSFNAALGGDPDRTEDARRAQHVLHEIQEQFGVAFGLTWELRKPPPGTKPRYSLADLKGNNVIAYDCDAVVMLRPTDESRRTLEVKFPGLRHCEDLPDDYVLDREGLSFKLRKTIAPAGADSNEELDEALREHLQASGRMVWRDCRDFLRSRNMHIRNDRIGPAIKRVMG